MIPFWQGPFAPARKRNLNEAAAYKDLAGKHQTGDVMYLGALKYEFSDNLPDAARLESWGTEGISPSKAIEAKARLRREGKKATVLLGILIASCI
jgi:hypothetical protein